MKIFATLLILFTTFSVAAFAADGGSGKIHLYSPTKVGATELPAGDYKVTWTGAGDNAQVTLKQGKTSATTAAHLVDVRRNNDGIGTKTENGAVVLTEIQFKDKTLLLDQGTVQNAGR